MDRCRRIAVVRHGRVTMVVVRLVDSRRRPIGLMRMILVTLMSLRLSGSVVVMAVSDDRSGVAIVIVAVDFGGGRGRCVVTMTGVCAVIIVRLVLVAHYDFVPQPLSAVFAAKSV